MIYVFSGDDQNKKTKARDEILQNFLDREVFFVREDNFVLEDFQNFLVGGDLFSREYVVVFDGIISSDLGEVVLEKVKDMSKSKTVFVILENGLLKAPTDIFKKAATDFQEFDLPKTKQEKFNIFSITDAFGARDKKNTWVLTQKALRQGVSSEEILNILIWQVKNLLNVSKSTNAQDSGLAPFVYNKSKSYSKNYKAEELQEISRNLVEMFHQSHLGLDLEPNLEKFLLQTL